MANNNKAMKHCKWLVLLCLILISCGSKSKVDSDADEAIKKEAAEVNAAADSLFNMEYTEEDIINHAVSLWDVGYLKDDFGEEIMSQPYISQKFYGKSRTGDCDLKIMISNAHGIVFIVHDEFMTISFNEYRLTVKRGDDVFNLKADNAEDSSLQFYSQESLATIVDLLDGGVPFKLAILNEDFIGTQSQLIFEFDGNACVRYAMINSGVISSSSNDENMDDTNTVE